ncbi:MAG: aminotransferase class V-fold PLP-dependent enzyme [Quadrisphaera sp.]
MTHYLDHAATSPPTREVLEAVWPYLVQVTANPASVHTPGQQAKEGLERARATAASALGCRPGEVVFTSGGTESDGLAVLGIAPAVVAARGRERHLVTTAVEHSAVLEPARELERRGWRVDVVGVDGEGRVDLPALSEVVTERTALVSVMHANNEVGTVQPLAGVSQVCAERGVALHVDAVQSAGVLDLRDLWSLGGPAGGVAAVSVSAHKLGGLRGSGLLAVRSGTPLEPVALGGGQERGRRSGTVDVASAVGLATALSAAAARREHEVARLAGLRDRLVAGVLEVGVAGGRRRAADRRGTGPGAAARARVVRAAGPVRRGGARGARPGRRGVLVGVGVLRGQRRRLPRPPRDGTVRRRRAHLGPCHPRLELHRRRRRRAPRRPAHGPVTITAVSSGPPPRGPVGPAVALGLLGAVVALSLVGAVLAPGVGHLLVGVVLPLRVLGLLAGVAAVVFGARVLQVARRGGGGRGAGRQRDGRWDWSPWWGWSPRSPWS